MRPPLLLLCLLLVPARSPAAAPPRAAKAATPDFDRVIAPLLTRYCTDCHGGPAPRGKLDLTRRRNALATGKRAVIVPGKPADSELWTRVAEDQMPPKKALPAADKQLLHAWIAGGAPWGTDPIDPFRLTTENRAGQDWWSLRPLLRPAAPVPAPGSSALASNPIDRFVQSRLAAKGLAPSPPTDRRTLARRLSHDLTGLPPTPEEVRAFEGDSAPDAVGRFADRLLASPHHGERWGRHWLDVVRFGESDGFERDLPRFNAWPYRDWVVAAFNRDLPYDEFVRTQLAGDVLRPGDAGALTATGFLVAGSHDIVVPVSENMKATMFQDELEDLIGTVGQTFLGLTLNCARCHDHKFDPISQADYYRLAASLGGVRHGERTLARPDTAGQLAALRRRQAELLRELEGIEAPVRARLLAARGPDSAAPRPLGEWDFRAGLGDGRGRLPVELRGGATRGPEGLNLDGRSGFALSAPLGVALGAKTLEAWVRLGDLGQRGGGVLTVQTLDGNVFDSVVFGEQQPGRWMAGSDSFRRTREAGGPVEAEAKDRPVHVAVTWAADGTVTLYREGRPHGVPYKVALQTFEAGRAQVAFGLRHAPAGGNRLLRGTLTRARLHDRALTAEEVARSFGNFLPEADLVAGLAPEGRRQRDHLRAELGRAAAAVTALEAGQARKLYAVNATQPGPTHVLLRGSVAARGEKVPPAPPRVLERLGPSLADDAPEGERRRALGEWLTRPDNSLFARVMVNRLWHWHFGTGLVSTPSDLGFNGGAPSHPELLDWLACELIDSGWSLKHLHRLIVTSATYAQSSNPRAEASKVDADNRLLWRRAPVRLEAEAVRDSMLAVAGRLDARVGGPPYHDFRTYFFKGTQFYDPVEPAGEAATRRTLYRLWARGGRSPFLDTFDCPDPSTTTPSRSSTTTPLQALTLLNNALVLDLADALAERVTREVGADRGRQVARVWQLALGRDPSPRERDLLGPFVARHGLAALCRVAFNSNEFMQVD